MFLKSKIMDNIHKYYFLIAFTAYMRYYKGDLGNHFFTSFVNFLISFDHNLFLREAAELARNAATEEAKANALTGGKVLFYIHKVELQGFPKVARSFFTFSNFYKGVINLKVSQKILLIAN